MMCMNLIGNLTFLFSKWKHGVVTVMKESDRLLSGVSGKEECLAARLQPLKKISNLPETSFLREFVGTVTKSVKLSMSRIFIFIQQNPRPCNSFWKLQALTCHACLPAFFLIPAIIYTSSQLSAYYNPMVEYSLALADFIPMLSPFSSLLFIRPYREWIRDTFLRRCSTTSDNSDKRIFLLQRY